VVIHYVAFVLAVSIPIFIIVTFVACFRMRDLKHKKLWLAFVLFGVSGFALNWTTGGVAIKILSIQLLGAGFTMASQWAPLMLKVSVPLGAILFWVLRQSGQLALKSEQPVEDSHPGDR
jgi:hypothetical protein